MFCNVARVIGVPPETRHSRHPLVEKKIRIVREYITGIYGCSPERSPILYPPTGRNEVPIGKINWNRERESDVSF